MIPAPKVSVAPMMERTDRHYRYLARLISRNIFLYTEMVTARAIIHGDREYLLGFDPAEHPISLQLGGDSPDELSLAVELASPYLYDEYNLNIGCPSDRVQEGRFGACLMARPAHVANLVRAMKASTDRPVTVKNRIGIDGLESYDDLCRFIETVSIAEPARFTIHARIAILNGLNPKENRSIPPLRYDDVYRIKKQFPDLQIEINGGISRVDEIREHLRYVDGVMIGREAYENPYLLAAIEREVFGTRSGIPTRRQVVQAMIPYLEHWISRGVSPHTMTRHMLGLFSHRPGTKRWKRFLSGGLPRDLDAVSLFRQALELIPDDVLDETAA